jgi:hypothetical protein
MIYIVILNVIEILFHININDSEEIYNVGGVLHCVADKGDVNYTIIEKYDN